jgi:hypothetical protein
VVTTWGYSLSAKPSNLGFEDSVYIYARIVMSAQEYPVPFTYAVRHAQLFDLLPELDTLATVLGDSMPVAAAAARAASRALAPTLASATPGDWLGRLRLRTGVQCIDETRLSNEICRALLESTAAMARSIGNLSQIQQAAAQYRAQLNAVVGAKRMSPEVSGSLNTVLGGLLRAAGDPQAVRPIIRAEILRPVVRRPPD